MKPAMLVTHDYDMWTSIYHPMLRSDPIKDHGQNGMSAVVVVSALALLTHLTNAQKALSTLYC